MSKENKWAKIFFFSITETYILVFIKSVYLLLAFVFNMSRSGVLRVYFMWRHLEHWSFLTMTWIGMSYRRYDMFTSWILLSMVIRNLKWMHIVSALYSEVLITSKLANRGVFPLHCTFFRHYISHELYRILAW